VAAAGDLAPQFVDTTVLVPKLVVNGFPFIAKVVITNISTHRMPVKVFDFANGGGFSDFSITFSRDGSEVGRFERPLVLHFMEPLSAVRQDHAKAAWLEPGESIEMWFDINHATYLETSFTEGVLQQFLPEYPLGDSLVTLNFGGDIGAVDAGVVTFREPALAEREFLDLVRVRAGAHPLFLKTFVLDVGELPEDPGLPADTNELMSVMMVLKRCVTCIGSDGVPHGFAATISSAVYRELYEVIQVECRCAWSLNLEPIQIEEPQSQSFNTLLRKGGGPVGSLKNKLKERSSSP